VALRVEAHGLAARGDRRHHLRRAVREEQEHDVVRRLLERLEQRVGRLVVERVGALEHEDAEAGLEGRVRRGCDDGLVDVAAQHLVRAARRDPGEVGMRAVLHAQPRAARVARAASEQLRGHRSRRLALPAARRAVQQVRVRGRPRRGGPEHGGGVGMRLERGEGHGASA
jgi:hypothetical protein